MKKVKEAILHLETQQMEYEGVKEELSSAHHVLSEAVLSLMEEHQDGMNKFQVKEMYWKLNSIKKLLFYVSINMKKDNENMDKHVSIIMDELLSEEDWEGKEG